MLTTTRLHLVCALGWAVTAGLAFGVMPNKGAAPAEPPYRLSGPYTHDNLTVFLLHGADGVKDKKFLTLDEALKAKKVIVHETRDPGKLSIENVSREDVFVQAGDIVKGGQQDRTIAVDLVVPPKSGKVPVNSFCVEAPLGGVKGSGMGLRHGPEGLRQFCRIETIVEDHPLLGWLTPSLLSPHARAHRLSVGWCRRAAR